MRDIDIPDEEIELGKGRIIVRGKFYKAARKTVMFGMPQISLLLDPLSFYP